MFRKYGYVDAIGFPGWSADQLGAKLLGYVVRSHMRFGNFNQFPDDFAGGTKIYRQRERETCNMSKNGHIEIY